MKRLFLAILFVLLWSLPCYAQSPLAKAQPVKYRGTITGLLISGVDGTAFVDAANASVTALADGNHQITVFDSSGRFIRGVLSAAGTGETLSGVELVTDGAFTDTANWTEQTNWAVAGGVAASTGSNAGQAVYQNFSITAAKLYKISVSCAPYTSGYGAFLCDGSTTFPVSVTGAGAFATYRTPTTTGSKDFGIASGVTPFVASIDNLSLQQVLTPSTSGAVIVSTKGGATQNWAYKNASFTWNQSAYTVIVRKLR